MSSIILKKDFAYINSMRKCNSVPKKNRKNIAMEKTVLLFGGTVKLSKKLNVDQGNVSKWLHSKLPIPLRHAIKIEQLTKGEIKVKDLRPDVYDS